MRYADPSGHFIETVLDIISVGMDVADIAQNGLNWGNGLSLAVDVASVLLPGIPAIGAAVRAINAVDTVVDVVNVADAVVDTANAVDTIADVAKVADDVVDGANALDNVGDGAKSLDCLVNSFSADTDVVTTEGSVDIATLQVGDYVLAWNEADGTLGFYQITDTIHHTDKVVVNLLLDGEWIETTPEHPFYVEGKGWVNAEDLQFGDQVYQADGTTGVVWIKWNVYKTQEMYNLSVDTAHTFFVGEGQWLVHNCGGNSWWADEKVTKQMNGKRNWSSSDIDDVLSNPVDTASTRDTRHNINSVVTDQGPATAYYRADGHYVVQHDITGEIIQVSDTSNPNWFDDILKQTIWRRK